MNGTQWKDFNSGKLSLTVEYTSLAVGKYSSSDAPEKADKAIGKKRVDGEGPSRKKKRKTRPETSSTGASVAWLDALMDQADKQDPPHHEVIYEHAEKNAANADAGNEYGDKNLINEGHDDNAKEGFGMRT
ncbi:hypothetical protein Tco_0238044 [Tanacetum coccineum]